MKYCKASLFIVLFTLVSCSKTKVPDANVGTQQVNEPMQVVLFNYEFYPAELVVPVGKKVEFTNKEAAKHCLRIAGVDVSEDMEPGATFSYTFEKGGNYEMTNSCGPARMKGVIIAKENK